MRFRSGPGMVLGLLLCASAAADPVLEPGAARAAASGAQVDEILTRIGQAADQGSATALVDLAGVIAARDLHPAARDRVLRELAMALARVRPDAATRALIDELAQRPPGVRVWLREGHHRIDVLLYDVAAAARYTSRRWTEAAARREAHAAMEIRDATLVERFAAGDAAFRKGVVAALDGVHDDALLAFRDPVIMALRAGADVGALALPVTLRLEDPELAAALLLHGDATLLVHALPRIAMALGAADALTIYESALARDDIASAVMFEIGRLAAKDGRAVDVLFEFLDDPDVGGSAAAALARLDDPHIALDLGRRLEGGGSGLPERRALLALRLSDTDAARDALDRFMRSSTASAELQHEAALWTRP
ncbi:MAG: hypothetical protein ACREVN_09675 [Gammaproteobacteria bacterium]